MGKRLGKLTENSTKCMVSVNGKRLIEYTLDAVAAAGVNKAVLIVGHGAEEVKSLLGTSFGGLKISYVHNPVYAQTNNIYSLLLAREHLEVDDTLLLESDLIFEKSILRKCIADNSPNVAVVAKFESWMDGTVTILDEQNRISSFIPKKDFNWIDSDRYYKTVNIYKLSKEFSAKKLVPFLLAYTSAKGLNEYYEEVLRILSIIDAGQLKAMPVADGNWYEIDDQQDLDIASALFAEGKGKLDAFQKRYGGYWRFPKLRDYCYLVNPYFPSPKMMKEFERSFPGLLERYPSGLSVQNLLASKLFGVETENILVGNGASELIKHLLPQLSGPIGIPVPTFDEYVHAAPQGTIVEFLPHRPDFHYTVEDLLSFCRSASLSSLVLINPDNPTGHFLPREDVVRLLLELQKLKITLVLDESFIDFVDGSHGHSMTDNGDFKNFKNLVVIKSISKSYGVPGLRLGVLVAADETLVSAVKKRLSIWNINSFGEFFLQIIGKYLPVYKSACEQLAAERTRLHKELLKVPFLRPIPSAANYILCEVREKWKAEPLTQKLLDEKWLFVKDCSGKRGFEGKSYIRFAVRDTADNDFLLESLHSLK